MIAFAGSVPENYDSHLRDVLFAPYAADLARRIGRPGKILEVACGTGVLTDAMSRMHPDATIVATDLNQGMIDVGREKVRSTRIAWRQADATGLPFGDQEFDAVVCQFGFMFVPDKLAAFREMRRVLRPAGRLVFNVWDSLAENDASRILNDMMLARFPDDPPRFVELPFSMFDREEITRLLTRAGFDDIISTDVSINMPRSQAKAFAAGMIKGTPLFDGLQQRGADHEALIAGLTRAIEDYRGDLRMRAIVFETMRAARSD